MMKTQTRKFWIDSFEIQQPDIDYLVNVLLESEMPLSVDEMALLLVRYRVRRDERRAQRASRPGRVYRPGEEHDIGDDLVFLHLDRLRGEVVDKREGGNEDIGSFTVIAVEFDDGPTREFASELAAAHPVNDLEDEPIVEEKKLTAEEIFIEYGGHVAELLQAQLVEHPDLVRLGQYWFPRSLLIEINEGHLNLAEAVLFMHEGGPLTASDIIEQMGMLDDVGDRLAEFSLNYAMTADGRFDEVGPSGQVLWYLMSQEPAEVHEPPALLAYEPIPFSEGLLLDEMWDLIEQIGDEHSLFEETNVIPEEVTLRITYPHWREGTLPLSRDLLKIFPTAFQSERIRFTLIDESSGEEYPAWVVRTEGYVFGLATWYEQYDLLPGSIVTVKGMDDQGRVPLSIQQKGTQTEWVVTASVESNRHLRFESRSRKIANDYDYLMLIDVDDPEAVDTLAGVLKRRGATLDEIVGTVMHELTPIFPQGNIHGKTIYAAVNTVYRAPPGPIFAALQVSSRFDYQGGLYWRIAESTEA